MKIAILPFIWCLLLVCQSTGAGAQPVISGKVVDSQQVPVAGVTVSYSHTGSSIILGFAQTDNNGSFSLLVNSKEDSLVLHLSHIAYAGQLLRIANRSASYSFTLVPKAMELKEVVVQAPPVYKINDTINYNVKAFTSKEDKVIGDVIKKLPGVEVDNGKILYQGKPIQEYLINGLNLLDAQYQLANNNLPADAVLKVQVIENHQPIKVLDSLVFSNRASLNLQLKKLTTTGSGKVAVGYKPVLWDVNLTPMVFNKNFQTLNTLQANNVGHDVAAELFRASVSANSIFGAQEDMNLPQVDFLSLQRPVAPPFTQRRWLNNNIFMGSSNMIRKFRNGLELKGKVAYFDDYTREYGQTQTRMYLPGHTVTVSELVNNTSHTNDLRGGFSLTRNERKGYIKNNTLFGRQWNNDRGFIQRNDTSDIFQGKRFKGINFSNDFSAIVVRGKQLVTFQSKVGYFENPQQLSVTPGPFDSVLNEGKPYDKARQTVFYKNLDLDHSISMVKGYKRLSLVPRVGFRYAQQQMESGLATITSSVERELGAPFQNGITFKTRHAYLELLSQYKSQRLRAELNLPVGAREFSLDRTSVLQKDPSLRRITVEPKVFLKYNLSALWETSFSSKYHRQFGGITQLYDAYVLSMYSSLKRFNATVPESRAWENYWSLNYKNTLKATFANIMLISRQQANNFLFEHMVDAKGVSTLLLRSQDNDQTSLSVNADLGKYLGKLKTTLKVRGGASFYEQQQGINSQVIPLHQSRYNMGVNIYNSALEYLTVGYNGDVTLIGNKTDGRSLEDIRLQVHGLTVGAFPVKNHSLTVHADYYLNNRRGQQEQLFVDLLYRFSIPKTKWNIEVSCNNLFNHTMFTSVGSSSFMVVESSFKLRPRQVLVGTWFKF